MHLFESLGFSWERQRIPEAGPVHSVERTCFHFHRSLPECTWDTCVLEGNPYTFVEVKTLLDGITVGGRRVSDQAQILDMAASAKRLLAMVKTGAFALSWETFVVGTMRWLTRACSGMRIWLRWGVPSHVRAPTPVEKSEFTYFRSPNGSRQSTASPSTAPEGQEAPLEPGGQLDAKDALMSYRMACKWTTG